MHIDKGFEFKNKEFNSLINKYNIKLYHTKNEEKSAIIERYNRTQNERIKVIFDPKRPNNYLLYVDANNLYGWALS